MIGTTAFRLGIVRGADPTTWQDRWDAFALDAARRPSSAGDPVAERAAG
jgi:hypothetical protein